MKKIFSLASSIKQLRSIISVFSVLRTVNFIFILTSGTVLQPAIASTNISGSVDSQTLSVPKTPEARMSLFRKAVSDDLSGDHLSARKIWDDLANTNMAKQVAVPSAINLVALGKFDEAGKAFDIISVSHNPRESDYAQLWQLWLTARTYVGKPAGLKNELAILTSGMNLGLPSRRALVRLYSGQGSIDEVFASIAALPGANELQRRDALTEVTFFAGAYQEYVARDRQAALKLYEREQNQLNSSSLECPLINKAIAKLQVAKN